MIPPPSSLSLSRLWHITTQAAAMSSSSSSSNLHFLLLPFPEQGHISPMLSLASHLAALGSIVTFVKAEKPPLATDLVQEANYVNAKKDPLAVQQHLRSKLPNPSNVSNLRFWTMHCRTGESSTLTESSPRFEKLKHKLASLEERQGMVEKLVQESKASDAPITCIICDIFLCNWVINLAKRQAILAATHVSCAALNFYLTYLLKLGKSQENEELRLRFGILQKEETLIPTIDAEATKTMSNMLKFFWKLYDGVEEASHILVNSFRHLEAPLVESVEVTSELNIRFIGPCLPVWEAGGELENIMAKHAGCVFTEDPACLPWLDRQEKGSVLLVSFGSEMSLVAEQVQELALGIEASGFKFLWVVRPDAPSDGLPVEDFRERTCKCDVGMFASWVPQRRVLQHTAVGGFLTHCGWNSTLESIMFGVPMLCIPLNGDQFFNAHLIQRHWKVGLPLGPPCTLVQRADVEKAVRALMSSDDLRQRVAQLQQAADCAILESQNSLTCFVQDIDKRSHQKLPNLLG